MAASSPDIPDARGAPGPINASVDITQSSRKVRRRAADTALFPRHGTNVPPRLQDGVAGPSAQWPDGAIRKAQPGGLSFPRHAP